MVDKYEDIQEKDGVYSQEEAEQQDVDFTYDINAVNLVTEFQKHPDGKMEIKKIVESAREDFHDAWEKSEGYRKRVSDLWKIVYCDLPPKNAPFQHCANTAIPSALTNLTRLTNKVYRELFGDLHHVVTFSPVSSDEQPVADLVTKHTNWQIRNKLPGFKRQQHRGLFSFFGAGEVTFHSYYDTQTKQNVHNMLTCDDFVVPYTHVSTSVDFSDVPWLAKRMPFFKHQLSRMKQAWENVDKLLKHEPMKSGEGELDPKLRQTVGTFFKEDKDDSRPCEYVIIHYEGWMKLPNEEEYRYCQLIFDYESSIPLKFSLHEEEDPLDRQRFDYQMGQLEQYQMEVQQYNQVLEQKLETQQTLADTAVELPQNSSMVGDLVATAQQVEDEFPEPSRPIPPSWMLTDDMEPDPVITKPIHMFSHAVCLEPMTGNHGVGLGLIYTQLNKSTNQVFNQFSDAATLANGGSYITAGNLGMTKMKIGPGEINVAKNVHASDLKNSIVPLSFGGANPQLIDLFSILMSQAESAGHTPALMSGEPGKSGETARGLQSRVEQMNSMIGVPAEKYGDLFVQLMKNNAKLNSMFLDESEVFYVSDNKIDPSSARQQYEIARQAYDNVYMIELRSDLQFKSRADKVSEADELVQMPNAVGLLQMNPHFMTFAVRRALEARGLGWIANKLIADVPPEIPVPPLVMPPPTPEGENGPQ